MFRLPKISVSWEDDADKNFASEQAPSSALNKTENPTDAKEKTSSPINEIAAPKKRSLLDHVLGLNKPPIPPRPFLKRLLGLRIGQFINLFIWSAVAGLVMHLTNFNPLNPQFNATETAGNVWQQGWSAFVWAIKASWKPALTGATVILPIWFFWRVLTFPFRR